MKKILFLPILVLLVTASFNPIDRGRSLPLYINDIVITVDGKMLVATSGTSELRFCNIRGKTIRTWKFDGDVTGIAQDNNLMYVTSSGNKSYITLVDPDRKGPLSSIEIGAGARSPVLSPDKKSLYVASQYESSVYKVDLKEQKVTGNIKVSREPYSMIISPDGKFLLVTNFLPAGRADDDYVAAKVSVIDLKTFTKIRDIGLSNGSNALKGICISPDGKYAFVVHNLGRFQIPTSQLEQGWMNTAGLSVIDFHKLDLLATVILDESGHGAAGSWDVMCTENKILVTHSGTHDLSVIDYEAFIKRLLEVQDREGLSYNLDFLKGIRKRYPLAGNGPRRIALSGTRAYIPSYFSDDLNIFDLKSGSSVAVSLNPERYESVGDKGYRIFNDASYCFQGWQSCNGCHPGDAGADGLNWDLLNDGVGNPKNTKSLLFSQVTPPVMISGIRESAEVAVRSGFMHIQFSEINEDDARSVDAYLRSLTPVPSPWLVNGNLSENAEKGKMIFEREGCIACHSGEYFTDKRSYKIGEAEKVSTEWNGWDTPALREAWRTAPYLFDGSAADMKEVFGVHSHGLEHTLSGEEIDQLSEYVNSL